MQITEGGKSDSAGRKILVIRPALNYRRFVLVLQLSDFGLIESSELVVSVWRSVCWSCGGELGVVEAV